MKIRRTIKLFLIMLCLMTASIAAQTGEPELMDVFVTETASLELEPPEAKDDSDSVHIYYAKTFYPASANIGGQETELEDVFITKPAPSERSLPKAVFIAAAYKGDQLCGVSYSEYVNLTDKMQLQTTISGLDAAENLHKYHIKTFLWDDFHYTRPYKLLRNTVYVAPFGDDNGTGGAADPFLTIARAQERVREMNADMDGDIIVSLYPGEYFCADTLEFTAADSGKNGYNVIYQGASGAQPSVIHGGVAVSGWTPAGGGIWQSDPVNTDVRQLYVNDRRAQRARSSQTYQAVANYSKPDNEYDSDGIIVDKSSFPANLSNVSDIELVWNIAWANQRLPVSKIEEIGDQKVVLMEQPYYHWARTKSNTMTNPDAARAFYIENAKELLDEPGEFYFDKSTGIVYYYPLSQDDMLAASCYAAATDVLIDVRGESAQAKASNIIFENLSFKYGAWSEPNTTGVTIFQAEKMLTGANQGASGGAIVPAQIQMNNSDNIIFRNNVIEHMGSVGIGMTVGVTNCKISGNVIRDVSAAAITIGDWDNYESGLCKDNEISNNVIRNTAQEYYSSPAITMYYVNGTEVRNNDIQNTSYTGISLGWGWGANITQCSNNRISNNVIKNVMTSMIDGAHIYTLGPITNCRVDGNYLVNSPSFGGGLYPDEGSQHIIYKNNVIEQCESWMFIHVPSISNLYVLNNYTDTPVYTNKGTNNTIYGTVVKGAEWSAGAQAIINKAGLEQDFEHLLNKLK